MSDDGAMAPWALQVRDLVRHIPITRGAVLKRVIGQVKAVDGVSLNLRRGEMLGLVGESGCGKSTLAKLLVALDRPTSGEVRVLGERIDNLAGEELRRARRHIQLVFQDPFTSLDPRMTVARIVGEPFLAHPDAVRKSARQDRVRELLELVGLNPDHANRYPHQFSGGQRQRIGIARALALQPEVLVCDEAVSALDVSVQAQIINLLVTLRREIGIACVFIAHDLAVVEYLADQVAVMYLGRIVEQGAAEVVYDDPRHPYTSALLSAIPEPDPAQNKSRARIRLEGDVPSPIDPPSGCRFRTRCWQATERCAEEQPILSPQAGAAYHSAACHYPLTAIGPAPAS